MLWRGRIVAGVGGALGVVILRCLLGFGCEPNKTQRGSSYGIVGAATSGHETTL